MQYSRKQIYDIINSIGLPCAYRAFEDRTEIYPQYIVYYYSNYDGFFADNINYKGIVTVRIEVYTQEKDFDLEDTVENILTENELTWEKDEAYIEDQNQYMIVYQSEVLING